MQTALHPGQLPAAVLQPRMAQLETLEAKLFTVQLMNPSLSCSQMASIEVSLSTTPRRKKNGGSIGGGVTGPTPAHRVTSKDIAKELEVLRNALRDKENIIQSLQGELCSSLSLSRLSATYLRGHPHLLTDKEKRAAEERLNKLRHDMDNKRLAIKNLKMALDRLDITEFPSIQNELRSNIDVRIQQAELEYQLGREELNLLTLLEESRNLQLCLEDAEQSRARADQATIYNCVKGCLNASLHAVELDYDPKSPQFGAGPRDNTPGLYVKWATEESGMLKGDRVVEVNGKLVLGKTKEDMVRLLAVAPSPAQLVLLRARNSTSHHALEQKLRSLHEELRVTVEQAQECERDKEALKTDNVRLTHRISYLEEQVAELLDRTKDEAQLPPAMTTQPTIAAPSSSSSSSNGSSTTPGTPTKGGVKPDIQVFQKGPQVTAIVANLPGLDVGGNSPGESRHTLPTLRPKPPGHHTEPPAQNQDSRSTKSSEVASDLSSGADHAHHVRRKQDRNLSHPTLQNARSTNSLDMSKMEHLHQKLSSRFHSQYHLPDHQSHHPTKTNHSVSETSLGADGHCSRHRKHPDGHHRQTEYRLISEVNCARPTNYNSESSNSTYVTLDRDVRSVKSLDFDSEPNGSPRHGHKGWRYPRHKHGSRSNRSVDEGSETSSNVSYPQNWKLHNGTNGVVIDGKPQRPTPPKKPLRLSLHRATSLQVVNVTPPPQTPPDSGRRSSKRTHKGESHVVLQIESPSRTPSRAESCQPSLRWSTSLCPSRGISHSSMANEKWC
uniref:PDZ domain-containing protein n=1 Tax=Timema douglasi TaxID=61478 RepID=A0A7R8VPC0_TIMDO|nr:unnamed protein product [Timema douglasi]